MNDDEYGATLLRPLQVEPAGAPMIDVARAMREGRLMRRRRWAFGGGFLALFSAALVTGSLLITPAAHKPVLPPDPPLPKSCTLAALPTGKYKSVDTTGADPAGRWIFGMTNPVVDTGPMRYLIWHDGVVVADIGLPGDHLYLRDVNSSGVIVGENKRQPYVYRNGKLSPLKGGPGQAVGINAEGVIVGSLGDITMSDNTVPVRWRTPDAEPERLPIPAGTHVDGQSLTIAPDGTIAGRVYQPATAAAGPTAPSGSPVSRVLLWLPDGTVRELHAPPRASDPPALVSPLTFRLGWLYLEQRISGHSSGGLPAVEDTLLLRYDPASGVWQQVAGRKGIGNPENAQLPSSARSVFRFGTAKPLVYVGRRVLLLPMTAPIADPEIDSATATSISDDVHTLTGSLVSGSSDPKQPFRPVIWHCQ